MSKRRVPIIIVTLLLCISFGPSTFNKCKWALQHRKALQSKIDAAPLIEQYRYPRGGHILNIAEDSIYFAYSYASREKQETWLACVDRNSKEEVWFRSSDKWHSRTFTDEVIFEWWNEGNNETGRLEWIDPTTGRPIKTVRLEKTVRHTLLHPKDSDKVFVQYADKQMACIQVSTGNVIWEKNYLSVFQHGSFMKFGKVWADQALLEINEQRSSNNGGKTTRLLVDLNTGNWKHHLPANTYARENGYIYWRDDVSYLRNINDPDTEIQLETAENYQAIIDPKTGNRYSIIMDRHQLVLQDSEEKVILRSNRLLPNGIKVIDGLLIWTANQGRSFNVRDMETSTEWIFSMGYNFRLEQPGIIQTWGDYFLHTSDQNMLICRSRQTGHIIWQYPLASKDERSGSYFTITGHMLQAINEATLYSFDLRLSSEESLH